MDGVTTEPAPGVYTGKVVLTVSDPVAVDYENHGRVDHFEMANAVVISDGKYIPEKSVSAAVLAGTVSDTAVEGLNHRLRERQLLAASMWTATAWSPSTTPP